MKQVNAQRHSQRKKGWRRKRNNCLFIPGFAKTGIKPLKALDIRAPDVARVGQPVTIKVTEKHVYKPVPKAAVFAINVKDVVDETDDVESYAEMAKDKGYFIG